MIEWFNHLGGIWWVQITRALGQGSVVLLAVWFLTRLWPTMPVGARSWLWRLAYLKLMLTLIWLTPIEVPILPGKSMSGGMDHSLVPLRRVEVASSVASSVAPGQAASRSRGVLAVDVEKTGPRPTASVCLAALWALGVLCILVRSWRRVGLTGRLYQGSRPVDAPWVGKMYAELCREFGLRRSPNLRGHPEVRSPMVMGVLNPVILLPSALENPDMARTTRLMLAHELAHAKRGDLLWAWLRQLVNALFYFHPLVWLGSREWDLAQELACDEMAIRGAKATPANYSGVLLNVLEQENLS